VSELYVNSNIVHNKASARAVFAYQLFFRRLFLLCLRNGGGLLYFIGLFHGSLSGLLLGSYLFRLLQAGLLFLLARRSGLLVLGGVETLQHFVRVTTVSGRKEISDIDSEFNGVTGGARSEVVLSSL
jgi:hypothetical protein